MERAPSLGQALGAGLGQGLSQGINAAFQDMLREKSNIRQNKSLLSAMGPDMTKSLGLNEEDVDRYASLDPSLFMTAINLKLQQGNLGGLSSSQLQSPLNRPPISEEVTDLSIPQRTRTLQPGVAPMLGQEDIPAEGEMPVRREPVRLQAARKGPEFRELPYEEKERQLRDYWDKKIASAPQNIASKYIAAKNQDLGNLRKNEELAEKKRSTALKLSSEEYKRHQDVIKRNEDISKPYLADITKREKTAVSQDMALQSAENAIRGGRTEGLIPFLANKYNWLPTQGADAATLNAAAKEFLFNNVTRVGSRPNMWLEQQVRAMFPQVGQSKEAALSVLEMIKNDNAVTQEEAKIARQIQKEYKDKGLDYVPSEIEQKVNERIIPFINARKEMLATRLKEIQEEKYSDSDLDKMAAKKVRQGEPLTDRMAEAILRKVNGNTSKASILAHKLGYEIPEE